MDEFFQRGTKEWREQIHNTNKGGGATKVVEPLIAPRVPFTSLPCDAARAIDDMKPKGWRLWLFRKIVEVDKFNDFFDYVLDLESGIRDTQRSIDYFMARLKTEDGVYAGMRDGKISTLSIGLLHTTHPGLKQMIEDIKQKAFNEGLEQGRAEEEKP